MVVNPYLLSLSLFLLSFAFVVLLNHRRLKAKRERLGICGGFY